MPLACDFILQNGLRVLFARRETSPIVEFRLVLDGGFAADPGTRKGLAALATGLFSDGLIRVSGAHLGSALDTLGAVAQARVMPDGAVIGISALDANLGAVLGTFVKVLTNLEFTRQDFELLRANR